MVTNTTNAIINYTYFCMNFTKDFIHKCWADEPEMINHLSSKFIEVYNRRGTGVVPFFMCELDRENQIKLSKWINKNYVGFPELHNDGTINNKG